LGVGHDHQGGSTVVQRAAVAGGNGAVGTEDGLELRDLLVGGAGTRAVVGGDHGAVRHGDGRDLLGEVAALDGLDGAVLRAHAPAVLLLAGDTGDLGDVLGGLAHRDVDIREDALLTRVGPHVGATLGALGG